MKSMTKLMVVAMLLVAALVVAPVAARTYDGEAADRIGIYNISPGDTIYVGEQHLRFNETAMPVGFGTGISGGRLVHFTDTTSNTTDVVIGIPDATDFELKSSDVGTVTGDYYVFANGVNIGFGNQAGTVFVQIPKVGLDVVLNATLIDSVNGKSITRTTPLAFKLTNNLDGFRNLPVVQQPRVKIEVSLPSGGKTTEFGGQPMGDLRANGSTVYVYSVNLTGYEAGTYTAQVKWYDNGPGASFYGKGFDSNTVTFDVTTKALSLTANKDSVVRGKSFSVTIAGDSKTDYLLFVKEVSSITPNEYPLVAPGQPGVKNITSADYDLFFPALPNDVKNTVKGIVPDKDYTQAVVQTDAGGTRTVQFNTTPQTKDRQFTIRVQDLVDPTKYDEVKVKVEKGAVTITASGTGVYYIGEEITLEGTCTDSDDIYLFITGPNLYENGANLDDPTVKADPTKPNTFHHVEVETDDTWSYKWNTAGLNLDAGGYTIYAVSAPATKDDLSNVEYDTIAVQLRSGFISATTSGATIAKGDDLILTGTAQGDPDNVRVWVFGKNYFGDGRNLATYDVSVEDDGTFVFDDLDSAKTRNLASGQYFVIIQHPMTNDFGVHADTANGVIYGEGITNVTLTYLQAPAAANALINALDSPNIDDTYVKLTFIIEEPQIFIDPIGDVPAGSTFTISGTTNLAVGDTLSIEVTSAAFTPTGKGEAAGFTSFGATTQVKAGAGANTWSVEIDGSSFKPDQYIVKVECIENTDATATTTFNVVEARPTTQPTVSPTATVTTTTTATTTTEATPTESPGFGALLALAGLGAVAYLVLRRD